MVTTYNYDAANQLVNAQQDSVTTQYSYDANGSLISDGAKTYIYDSANRLIGVDGSDIDTTMTYNGLGQRLSMEALGVTTQYVMSGDQPLSADSGDNTTFYLYGLGAIAEKTDAWSYALADGLNTQRQLTDVNGEITFAARYSPWGETLETYGDGSFTFGYFGGLMDAATGLLYVGNGQYYDPATGRFLIRDAKSNQSNPYIPWDPTGALIGPLGLMAVIFSRRRKGSKWGAWLALLLVVGTVGMSLSACDLDEKITPGPIKVVIETSTPGTSVANVYQDGTLIGSQQFPPNSPITVVVATACATPSLTPIPPTETPTPTPSMTIPTGSVGLSSWGNNLKEMFDKYESGTFSIVDFTVLVLSGEFDPIVENSNMYSDSGFRQDVAHAATHWLYINQRELSKNALLNFLGAMDSARTRYFGWKSSGILAGPGRGDDLAKYVVKMMLNPPDE